MRKQLRSPEDQLDWKKSDMWKPYTKETADPPIVRDEEYESQTRITIFHSADTTLYEIVCGIYGLMFHTAFAETQEEAVRKYEGMKADLKQYIDSGMADAHFCETFTEQWN